MTNYHILYNDTIIGADIAIGGGSTTTQIMSKIKFWQARSRQRIQLALLDHRLLEDIGLNAEQVHAEVNKPFWKD